MSQSSARSTVFLQEMGIGVQWRLRHAPESDGFVAAVQALADGDLPPGEAPADVAPSDMARPTAPSAAPQAVGPQSAGSRPASQETAPQPAVSQPAARAAAHAAPAAPSSAADDESTAWFDDAPAVPAASAAAPHPASASRPAPTSASTPRSAPAAVQAPARPAARPPAPSDAASAGEDMSWFDDAPMPPAAQPAVGQPALTPPAAAQPAPAPQAGPVSDEAIAAMDWPALQAAVSSCTRCSLCETRQAAVNGHGAEHAAWIAIAGAPSRADEQAAQAVAGEAGQLLNNMLKAIDLKPESDAYVTNVVKCRPPERNPTADEVIACRPFLERELALTGATMAITFGQFAARGLMMGPAARGKVMRYNKLPVVATYHPDDLLSKPEDKAKAWADLCLAKASHA